MTKSSIILALALNVFKCVMIKALLWLASNTTIREVKWEVKIVAGIKYCDDKMNYSDWKSWSLASGANPRSHLSWADNKIIHKLVLNINFPRDIYYFPITSSPVCLTEASVDASPLHNWNNSFIFNQSHINTVPE